MRSTSAPGKLFSIPNRTPIFFILPFSLFFSLEQQVGTVGQFCATAEAAIFKDGGEVAYEAFELAAKLTLNLQLTRFWPGERLAAR
jgi:hypothetical protein